MTTEYDNFMMEPEVSVIKYIFARLPLDKQQEFIEWMNEYIMASTPRKKNMRDSI